MPSNRLPLGALPARFRRMRLLVVGCGDVGQRALRQLGGRMRVLALTSSPERVPALRAAGAVPLVGDLDRPATLRRLAGLAPRVLHLAPPPRESGAGDDRDSRTRALLQALARSGAVAAPDVLVYGSTTGVYGDCGGDWIDETRPVAPATARGRRRVDAERAVREAGTRGLRASILRIPGIYAPDRPAGTPRERLLRGTPALRAEDDVYTNHIHADDLARACIAGLFRGRPQRVYHASDDTQLRMGEYFDLAADLFGLPRPPRLSRTEAVAQLSPMQMSFMSESRRLRNRRLKQELRVRLAWPDVARGLQGSAS
ncbi:MAG: SDR family oxidoreductase [Pseudacidovorax sp.]|uniref:SDR family oxidoreductase n=1 Tax=Pseudacidovorax sp. TaxID=1934311 RepID=UPI001B408D9A|nr:SDR family oxidoreductase [Pseudacidovorax sp.]MBP6895176.1 SDR family oxidoreductase [Pseudacidovorax sp.]